MVENLESIKKELSEVKQELAEKCEECDKLKLYRNTLDNETHDLTASLFEEANKLVQNAFKKQQDAESKLKQACQEIEALKIEVATLKALSLKIIDKNSTRKNVENKDKSPSRYFSRLLSSPPKTRKNPPTHLSVDTHHNKSSSARSAPSTPCHEKHADNFNTSQVNREAYEDFCLWRSNLALDQVNCNCLQPSVALDCTSDDKALLRHCRVIQSSSFLKRILDEDVVPCLRFANDEMAGNLSKAVHYNQLVIEPVTGRIVQSKCSLSNVQSICSYKMKLDGNWMPISLPTRNRIAKVCDLVTFIRYIKKGIIHYDANRMYNEFVKHQTELASSRIGKQFPMM